MSSTVVVAAAPDGDKGLKDSFTAHYLSCIVCLNSYKTKVGNGTVTFDRFACCGLCRDDIDIAALRNVEKWTARTDEVGACGACASRNGNIEVAVKGVAMPLVNKFRPAIIRGSEDAFKADAVLRAESRADRPPLPPYLATSTMAVENIFKLKTGCCGLSHACCTCCLCESIEQAARVGPADALTITKDKKHPIFYKRSIEVTGTTTDHVTLISAEEPVGACACTGVKPDYGKCACGFCSEQASIQVGTESIYNSPLSLTMEKGHSAPMTASVISRIIENPVLGAEETLFSFVSKHACFGRFGEVVITNKRVSYTGYKTSPFCCESLVPGLPNLLCCLFQVHSKTTIPLDKVAFVNVGSSGACGPYFDAVDSMRWSCSKMFTGGALGAGVWLCLAISYALQACVAPIFALLCWYWRMVDVKIMGQGGNIVAGVTVPTDSGGHNLRVLGAVIVDVVRKAQEANAAKIAHASSGSAKSAV